MLSNRNAWSLGMLATAAAIACVPAIATGLQKGPDEVEQAKIVARLVENGQVPLAVAVQLAERHVKGAAVTAAARVQADQPPGNGTAAGLEAGTGGEVILYRITCLDQPRVKLVTLEVNGVTREIKEVSAAVGTPEGS